MQRIVYSPETPTPCTAIWPTEIQSRPPADPTLFVKNQMNEAMNADGEAALDNIQAVLSVAEVGGDDDEGPKELSAQETEFLEDVLSVVTDKASNAPNTQQNTEKTLSVLATVSDSGLKSAHQRGAAWRSGEIVCAASFGSKRVYRV